MAAASGIGSTPTVGIEQSGCAAHGIASLYAAGTLTTTCPINVRVFIDHLVEQMRRPAWLDLVPDA
jgi:hypothetical protein